MSYYRKIIAKTLAKPVKKGNVTIEEVDKFPPEALKLIPSTDALKKYANTSKVEQRWVSLLDGKIVGLVTVEPPETHGLSYLGDTKFIQVFVSEKARGLGIGDKLLKTVFSEVDDPPMYWAGFTHHSEGFKQLALKYGIRDNDDVSRYDEEDPGWQNDGTYEEPENE
jgi:GNAT superfamily N-acetyltransferase